MWVYIWLGIIVTALIVEFSTADLVSIWFVAGGLVSLLLSLLTVKWYITIPCFIAVSLIMMLVFRKYVIKKFNLKNEKTNAETVIGKDFKLLSPISFNSAGTIKINDVIWNVITENNGDEIPKGTIVTVKNIKGNKYIVEVKK